MHPPKCVLADAEAGSQASEQKHVQVTEAAESGAGSLNARKQKMKRARQEERDEEKDWTSTKKQKDNNYTGKTQ